MAGALASRAEVEVLVAGGAGAAEEWDGALRIRRFPERRNGRERAALVYREVFGVEGAEGGFTNAWIADVSAEVAAELPELLGREIVAAGGGDSPELFEELADAGFDVVVFCGYRAASTLLGLGEVNERARKVLVPALREEPELRIPACTAALPAVERVLVATATERDLAAGAGADGARVREVGLVLRVSELGRGSEPAGLPERPYLLVSGDWRLSLPLFDLAALAERARRDLEHVELWFIGREAERVPERFAAHRRSLYNRMDLWRWMSRALLVCDPRPHRPFGLDVLEGMLCGAPILVPDSPGASREHAIRSGGGLWYR
ncbi:MAG: hypothetical protein ACREQY_12630, partial [Candidatus Binatia bacterium]